MSSEKTFSSEFVEDMARMKTDDRIVVLMYQSFCDPCNATKPTIEALSAEYGFSLLRINCDNKVDPSHAGTIIPSITAYSKGEAATPLKGARTRSKILKYLVDTGMVVL